jgi:predicted solute-binding protein
MKKYIKSKEENKLAVNLTQQKYAKSFKKVPHSYSEDGQLRFGDKVMLANKKTAGFLVIDMGDKIITHDEAYAVTTSKKAKVPSARNIFVIERAEKDDEFDDNVVHYGQKIQIKTNKHISGKNLHLHSCQISPL